MENILTKVISILLLSTNIKKLFSDKFEKKFYSNCENIKNEICYETSFKQMLLDVTRFCPLLNYRCLPNANQS